MFRRGKISTEVDQKPFYFTLIALIGSLAGTILIFALGGGDGLAIFAGILLGVVALASIATMFALLTDYASIDDGVLRLRYLFKKMEVPIDQIGKITFKDDVYSVYGRKGNLLGTVNGLLTGIDEILYELDRKGVRFE